MSGTHIPRRSVPLLWLLGVLTPSLTLLLGACLAGLERDPTVVGIAIAAAPVLPVPLRMGGPHWLLRQEPGWVSAYAAEYGGQAEDPALTVIRVARFTDVAAVQAAFGQLTPTTLYRLWQSQMVSVPTVVAAPSTVAGAAVLWLEYQPRPHPGEAATGFTVQLLLRHSGCTVIVIESLGVPRDQLPTVAAALVDAAHRRVGPLVDRGEHRGPMPASGRCPQRGDA
jgi:hypothetical protein